MKRYTKSIVSETSALIKVRVYGFKENKQPRKMIKKLLSEHTLPYDKEYRVLPLDNLITGEKYENILAFEQKLRELIRNNETGFDYFSYEIEPAKYPTDYYEPEYECIVPCLSRSLHEDILHDNAWMKFAGLSWETIKGTWNTTSD
jgi:hypothetical protein